MHEHEITMKYGKFKHNYLLKFIKCLFMILNALTHFDELKTYCKVQCNSIKVNEIFKYGNGSSY